MIETVTSRHNPLLVHVRKLFSSRAYRQAKGEFAADGVKLLREAIRWEFPITAVILTEGVELPDLADDVRVVRVPSDVMQSVSPMEAPQGALFTCRIPEQEPLRITRGTLILDELQDPGNLGTILRTADAMQVPVVLSEGCADLWNQKTVRATMGALFRTRTVRASREEIICEARSAGIPLIAAALTPRAEDIRSAPLDGAVIIGNEGRGICETFLRAADREIIIPMNERCESLNAAVAASIILWELRRDRPE
ncbi:MAG: RNA methyltransferase [Oscillospiraceae bacterium]|nr:RNA methyltransferase [Oscillospiraceae bacterium]MBR3849198.1 RNA methyltransferase [Oscillospiraceae bacterium]